MLGSRISTHSSRPGQSGDGRGVHDRPAATALDERDLVLHPEKHALQVDGYHPLEILKGVVLDPLCRARDAGIVEGGIKPARYGADLLDPSDHLYLARYVEFGGECPAILSADECCGLGKPIGIAIGEMHRRALTSEPECDRPTDSRTCAGNRGDLL